MPYLESLGVPGRYVVDGALPRDLLQERAPTVAPQEDEGEGRLLREGGRRAEVLGSDRGHGM